MRNVIVQGARVGWVTLVAGVCIGGCVSPFSFLPPQPSGAEGHTPPAVPIANVTPTSRPSAVAVPKAPIHTPTADEAADRVRLFGLISTIDGEPLAGATLTARLVDSTVHFANGSDTLTVTTVAPAAAREDGRQYNYAIEGVPAKELVRLTVQKPGYQRQEQSIVLSSLIRSPRADFGGPVGTCANGTADCYALMPLPK